MNCPFCNNEMVKGTIIGDGRSAVRWNTQDKKCGTEKLFDNVEKMLGKGCITAAKHSLTKFEIDGFYCESCKKMIFDTDIEK